MAKVYNFSAGPAVMPEPVLQQAQAEMLDWRGTGLSVMEMSHRSKAFVSIADEAEATLRELLRIPENYKVLFLQGGASAQFAAIPMNLLHERKHAQYVNTGAWSKKAIAEAQKYCAVHIAGSSEDSGFTRTPTQEELVLKNDAAYFHYTPNETIGGVEFSYVPHVVDMTLVADMSSNLLSQPTDVSRFGLIYAGAQKNIGPAGLTVVIIREDLLGKTDTAVPTMFNYTVMADKGSMYNTPPTFAIYIAGLVFKWLKKNGGLSAMAEQNARKAGKLYAAIDASGFYSNSVTKDSRSRMNVPFVLAKPELDQAFLEGAEKRALLTLKGHRSVGGMRASIYNAMPEAGVDALIAFMAEFEQAVH